MPIEGEIAAGLAVHEATTTGIHGVGAGTIVGTTLAQTLTGKTLTSPTVNGTIATTGLTMPAFTLGGNITGNGKVLTGLAGATFTTGSVLGSTVDNGLLYFKGATSDAKAATLRLSGADHASTGRLDIITPNAAADAGVTRLLISGKVAVAIATWSSVTHTGFDITAGQTLKVGGVSVVGAQGAAVADATDAPSVILRLNDLLARCRAHGLIAT